MAEFKAGDRVVKMSGTGAGKYGTVNSVSENGTLNVTFDGERLPRYCDPMRCGQVATNAKFKVGDKVKVVGKSLASKGWVGKVIKVDTSNKGWPYKVSFDGREDGEYAEAEIVAANAEGAKFKVGDKVVSIKTGRKGKIVSPGGRFDTKYGHFEMWNVWFDDGKEKIPVSLGSDEIRLANFRAANARKTVEWGKDNWYGDPVHVYLEDDGTYTFEYGPSGNLTEVKKGLTKEVAMKMLKDKTNGPRYNSRA